MSSFFRLREKIFLPGVEVGLRPSHPHHHLHELGRQAPHLGLQPLPETGEHDTAARQHDVPAVRNKLFIRDTGLCGCFSVKDITSYSQCCGAGLFCWSQSRLKSSGSGLLLCNLGVLWCVVAKLRQFFLIWSNFNNFYTN